MEVEDLVEPDRRSSSMRVCSTITIVLDRRGSPAFPFLKMGYISLFPVIRDFT